MDPEAPSITHALLGPGLGADPDDLETIRVRTAIESRLLGVPLVPTRIGRFILIGRLGSGGMGTVYAAFDPQLDRKVAIKLLFRKHDRARDRERLVVEAKAMARLAHPNVVHVYEVGEHEERLFLAMEYVRGPTLRAWLAEQPRRLRETLAICVQAGHGLAAAHHAGIVHRDFKPDNVLVGEDARARVVDFGVARSTEVATPDERMPGTAAAHERTSTDSGVVSGTPGYMSPEQLRGERADERSDQFSFCVTVWEALTGQLPFAGRDLEELRRAMESREITTPTTKLPASVEQTLRRVLTTEHRFVDMDALLRTLSRDPTRGRRRVLALAGVTIVVAASFAFGAAIGPNEQPCQGAADLLDASWAPERKDAAFARISAEGGAYGLSVAGRLRADIDDFAERWIAGHRDACEAHLRHGQSDTLLDRRMTCLERGRSAWSALARILDDAEREDLPDLVLAGSVLPDPGDCSDLDWLATRGDPIPADARALSLRVQEARTRFDAGLGDEVRAIMPELVAEARALGHGPTLAEALLVEGIALLQVQAREDATAALRESTRVALSSDAHEVAIAAWSNRLWAHSTGDPADDPDALDGLELMTALVERHRDRPVAVTFFNNVGSAANSRGRRDDGRAHFEHALELGRAIGPAARRQVADTARNLAFVTDDPQERDRRFADAVDAWTDLAGPDHPRTLMTRAIRASMQEDDALAIAWLSDAVAEMQRLHPTNKAALQGGARDLAVVADALGDRDRAIAAMRQQLAAEVTGDRRKLAESYVALWEGDAATAATLLEPVVDGYGTDADAEPRYYANVDHGEVELALGRAWSALGDPRAESMLARALVRFEHAHAAQSIPTIARRVAIAKREIADNRRGTMHR